MSAFGLEPPTPPIGQAKPSPILDLATAVNQVVTGWYGTKAEIARAKADQAVAEAQGRYAVTAATVGGLPSANTIILGAGALLAVMLLTRGGGRRR